MEKRQIWQIIRKRDYALTDTDVDRLTDIIFDKIQRGIYDFSTVRREVFTQQGKKREIYSFDKLSTEDVLIQYLKRQIDYSFKVKYASRSRIMNVLFNILPVVKDMNDFVIIRADFKSFFDSVKSQYVYEKYIRDSFLRRADKDIIKAYVDSIKYCYAGLCLPNGMTEIACRDFDERIKAKLSNYGVFFYERYVDDILLITNRYISKDAFLKITEDTICDVFEDCPVKLSTNPGKFSLISRRNLAPSQRFNFLGYEFEISQASGGIKIKYGLAEKKRKKYEGIIERAFIQYKADGNIELLRQRLKMYSARVVVAQTVGSNTYDWLTKGVVANYNELRFHIDEILPETKKFLQKLYFELFRKYSIALPYFMKQAVKEDSIYNLYSNLRRNRTIIFEQQNGVLEDDLLCWIRKIEPSYPGGKDYYRMVVDYLEMIKVK